MVIDLNELIKNATLSKDKVALNAYKNLKAQIQKNQTAKGAKPLTEELQLQIISSYSRNLEDAIKEFSEAHRDDLVAEYASELEVVKKLLPEPANKQQIYSELYKYCYQENFVTINNPEFGNCGTIKIPKKSMGNVIKYLKSKFPTTDGKMISEIVKKYIV